MVAGRGPACCSAVGFLSHVCGSLRVRTRPWREQMCLQVPDVCRPALQGMRGQPGPGGTLAQLAWSQVGLPLQLEEWKWARRTLAQQAAARGWGQAGGCARSQGAGVWRPAGLSSGRLQSCL